MNILFTAGGRRVEIIEIFKKELPQDKILVADVVNTAPALYAGDAHFIIPKFQEDHCLEAMLAICQENHVDAVIPLIDPEVRFYAKNINQFLAKKIKVMISNPDAINVATNKWYSYQFFKEHDIPTPLTFMDKKDVQSYPVMVKPISGSASQSIFVIQDHNGLRDISRFDHGYIFQEFIEGDEITVDVIGDGEGNVVATCQRMRLKTRAGEIERGITIYDAGIDKHIKKIVFLLKPWGLINIQLFKNQLGNFYFLEMNMRMGGGNPLTYKAGINIPRILKQLINNEYVHSKTLYGAADLCMLRFDEAFYFTKEELSYDQSRRNHEENLFLKRG